jgi:deoxycytidylate deaminase
MNKLTKQFLLLLIALIFVIGGLYLSSMYPDSPDTPEITDSNKFSSNTTNNQKSVIDDIVFKHIFEGNINRRGEATGFHHKPSSPGPDTEVIKTIKEANNCGVYVAQVKVQGKTKKAYSSMFPDKLNKSEIINILDSSYKKGISANPIKTIFTVQTDQCFKVTMILNNNRLATAYPLY